MTSPLTSSSLGRDVKLGVPCLGAACIVGLHKLQIAGNLTEKISVENRVHMTKRQHEDYLVEGEFANILM